MVVVYEGKVRTGEGKDSLALTNQEAAVFQENQPGRKVAMVQPLDTVQWALHYPALVDLHSRVDRENQSPEIRHAIELYQQGTLAKALTKLKRFLGWRR